MPFRSVALTVIVAIGAVVVAIGLRVAADEPPATESIPPSSAATAEVPPATAPPASAPLPVSPPPAPATTLPTTTTTTLAPGTTVCDRFVTVETIGTIENPALTEVSGVAAGRTNPEVLWVHNDSQDGPFIYAVDRAGADLGVFTLDGAFAFDWEDIAAGPGPVPGVSYLYVGDIGDNFEIRSGSITVYRVEEPTVADNDEVLTSVVALDLRYPEGSPNAEAMFIDPVDGALYIVTRDPDATKVYRADGSDAEGVQTMELVATLDLGHHVTGADIAPDGGVVALRGEAEVRLFVRSPGASIAEALAGEPCSAPSPEEIQGEALAILPDGSYVTVSEAAASPIQRVR